MSETQIDPTTRLLSGNTDAMVWATEWCRIAREIEADPDRGPIIDEGWMVGWFANAIMTGHDEGRRQEPNVDPLADTSPALIAALSHLFDEYGPLGVAETVEAMRKRP